MKEKTDRRIKKTKAVLRSCLLELMKEMPISRITPTQLCRKADINRNTFYSHYDSVEALLNSIESELFEQIKNSFQSESIVKMLLEICQTIDENRDLCRILFSENGNKSFLGDVIYSAKDKSIQEWKAAGLVAGEVQSLLMFSYFAHGSIAVIRDWVLKDMDATPKEIARFILSASSEGLASFAKPHTHQSV